MSNRRAAIRREEHERNKIMHSKAPDALIKQAYLKGRDEGMALASSIIFVALHDHYNFSSNEKGTGRLDTLIKYISHESMKMQQDATRFNVEFYMRRVKERTGMEIK